MTGFKMRPKPDDFRARYVELGKVGVGEYFGAHWKTVDRWVEEEGKDGLRAERAEWVAEQRPRKPARVDAPVDLGRPCDPDDLAAACQYLRERQGGGWRVGLRDDNRYFVGGRTMRACDVLDMALARGMDEFYVERDMFKRIDLHLGVDEWVLERESER